ncbi:helix-turn-helix transcriptional regulator [uncultured Pseudoflavonifractor sp.]|uniref:helix-turn-helix domain-containing protein n=1 Tax=uncultured Pseudoflavonifractor sp. TaxID=1221379 RepID=UPI0025CC60C2|nr:helix-turn-helix transcriptional regulator [uncultured Pseudoflavonifractor sp.]
MFEEQLYQLRRERGISQEELANVVGVSRQAVQKWESGASQPNMDNLIAISEYFGVTLDYLLKGPAPGWETTAGPPRRNIPSGLYSLRLPL